MYEFVLRLFKHNQGLRGKFWYSRKQKNVANRFSPPHTSYAKLDNGKIVPYSEMRSDFRGTSNWDDAKYLGRGRYYKTDKVQNR